MILTLAAATLAAAQPQTLPAPVPPAMDHSKMDQGKMNHGAPAATPAKMDCCKDGCACCAKTKAKPAA